MKKLPFTPLIFFLLFACKNQENEKPGNGKGEKKSEANKITYPYTAIYSSDISLGDPNHAKLVLNYFKCWEENRIDDMKTLLADTISINFSNGYKFHSGPGNLIAQAKQARSQYSSVVIALDAWVPIHLNDRNEDWVLVWEREKFIHKS